ncbi:iron uptake transporter permease EfeU [Gordonia hydrophobica]|uniref:Iron uptake transporter permease EfeU n=1 Tax=Gordonia hydrophobica TaxID=40516 RepID=A0ABZ2U2L6_9ACTN|nr:iron uptake transporter permease EfeU [Gordonia hydrophobica]MBM7368990.1 high-affinity iron transporter [Gordonia hydrophobica]
MTAFIAQGGPSVVTQMVGSGLIGVREGLEAGIVVMVLIAFAVKSDRRDSLKWIWLGVLAALAMMITAFLIIQFGSSTITSLGAELIAGIASLVAVGIVTFMVLWMRKASAHIAGDLKAGLSTAMTAGAGAVFGLAFLAVGREGFETALLMVGYAESVSGGVWPLVGLLLGMLVAVVLTWLLYKGAIRINFSKFFLYTGLFLIVVAAGILAYGVRALQVYGWLPGLDAIAFDISSWYDHGAWYGVILAGIFNFRPEPTVLQVIAWVGYVLIVGGLFIARGRSVTAKPTPATPALNTAD